MLPEKDRVRLLHMKDYAREASLLAKGKTLDDIKSNRMINLSLVRLLEIIGEAASRVSSNTQSAHPNIPWSQIISLRNRLIHGYDAVDFGILWTIVHKELPLLLEVLNQILELR
jgi:uncharacterized protein with HEPN domain